MTAHSDLNTAVNAYQQGAFDYLPKSFDIDETISLVERALNYYRNQQSNNGLNSFPTAPVTKIIGEAPVMQEVYRIILNKLQDARQDRERGLLFVSSAG